MTELSDMRVLGTVSAIQQNPRRTGLKTCFNWVKEGG